jgi:hypothetical protein
VGNTLNLKFLYFFEHLLNADKAMDINKSLCLSLRSLHSADLGKGINFSAFMQGRLRQGMEGNSVMGVHRRKGADMIEASLSKQ